MSGLPIAVQIDRHSRCRRLSLIQPLVPGVEGRDFRRGRSKVPVPVAWIMDPGLAEAADAALPSPFTSARSRMRRRRLPTVGAWREVGKFKCGCFEVPVAGDRETYTPAWPKPTISALPSPFTSASSRP